MSVDIENDGRALEQNLGRKSGESCNDSCSCGRNGQSQPGSGITNGRDGGNERAEDGNIPQKKDFSYTCTNISNTLEKLNIDDGCEEIQQTVYDNIRNIMDPEKPSNLEDLNVVNEEDVFVSKTGEDEYHIKIIFVPTVPHCSLAPLIGLCMRSKLRKTLVQSFKLDIFIKDGTHDTAAEINKQINDKERISAAMENPNLKRIVEQCIQEEY